MGENEQLQKELETARQRLTESYKLIAIGRLLAGIIHEIKTPIGSILSNNDTMQRSLEKVKSTLAKDGTAPPRVIEIIETLISLAAVDKIACERISAVVHSLKTFARVEEGDLRKADIHDILVNTIKLTACEFRRRVQVETVFGDLPEIECHPQLLDQVFLNLLVNAAQAIEGEGTVTVRTEREGEWAHISIQDSGHGIREEDRRRIFTTGFSTKPLGIGTGLGLSIARDIVVNKHGGTIDFESEPGKGTTFHVRLPITQPARTEQPQPETKEMP